MNKGKNEGITLIALVITIIVLLVIVGVALSLVIGENGLIGRTIDTKNTTEIAEEKELVELAVSTARIDGYGILTTDHLNNALQETFNNNEEVSEIEDGWEYNANRTYIIDNNGKVYVDNDANINNTDDMFKELNLKASQDKKLKLEINFSTDISIDYIAIEDSINNNLISFKSSDIQNSKIEIDTKMDDEKNVFIYSGGKYYLYKIKINSQKIANQNDTVRDLPNGAYAYGINGYYYYKEVSGDVSFNDIEFGDPLNGYAKYGYSLEAESIFVKKYKNKKEAFTDFDSSDFKITDRENGVYSFEGNGVFLEKIGSINVYVNNVISSTSTVTINDNNFTVNGSLGKDDAGLVEFIFLDGFKYKILFNIEENDITEQKIANENETVNTGGKFYYIKYGAGTRWIYKWIHGDSFVINNTNMGGDPASGTRKTAYLLKTAKIITEIVNN